MYQRFRAGLVNPRMLAEYFKDSWLKVLTYFFLLVILLLVPFLLVELQFEGLRGDQINAIRNNYQEAFVVPYEIKEGKLTLIGETDVLDRGLSVDMVTVSIKSRGTSLLSGEIEIFFGEDSVSYFVSGFRQKTYSYDLLNLEGFSFQNYGSLDQEKFIKAVNYVVKDNKALHVGVQTGLYFLGNAIELGLMVLLATLLSKQGIPFGPKMKIAVYASTIYAITGFFGIVFALQIIQYIGIALLAFYMHRALSQFVVL
ncbi:DUF1189 family protein [Acholeplasma equirhinis]|uniref:DUF1189 family protein n=1 Tax=Acholeplasma equirhinis TaxID=555393 RepID=UPI00197A84B0|nr:DUF1189 family protein [Acholeplasma equirhinis]MBN3490797.1 DUF1189 family protein [Acholeplasma equirhinis]